MGIKIVHTINLILEKYIKKILLSLMFIITFIIQSNESPIQQQDNEQSIKYLKLPFIKPKKKSHYDIDDYLSPDQQKVVFQTLDNTIERQANNELHSNLLFMGDCLAANELAVKRITKTLNADLLYIDMDEIIYERPRSVISKIFDHVQNHLKKNERPVVIWLDDRRSFYNLDTESYSDRSRYYNITLAIKKEIEKTWLNKNITLIMSIRPLSPAEGMEIFTEDLFSTIELWWPPLDIKGRHNLITHYFKKASLPNTVDIAKLVENTKKCKRYTLQDIIWKAEKIAKKENATSINENHILQARDIHDFRYQEEKKKEEQEYLKKLQKELAEEREREYMKEYYSFLSTNDNESQEMLYSGKNDNTSIKTILTLGYCIAGLVYWYNKTSSKKESKKSKKKTSKNKSLSHNQRPYEVHTL